MKLSIILVFLLSLYSCSFDNKTGIWENENIIKDENKKIFKDFKKIFISESSFNETIPPDTSKVFKISDPIINTNWNDIFYSYNNNTRNFKYNEIHEVIFKSKKLSKYSLNNFKLFNEGNLIISDVKGNLIIFSIYENKIISKYNFYKNRFKKIEKNLNYIVENDLIFVADNLGYFYAYNYKINKIIWAKNYKVPFSSNIKIYKNNIIVSNQNNNLFFISKKNGELIKLIPTEEIFLKNDFFNNLSVDNDNLFFLNTFGSLYSVNLKTLSINWFNNFNKSIDLLPSNLFIGNKIVTTDKEIIISSNTNTFIINKNSGSIIKKYNFSTKIKPIVVNNLIIFLTKNNFLLTLDSNTKKIIYSFNLNEYDKSISNVSQNNIYKEIMILNDEIYIFLNNSKILNFYINGKFKQKIKINSKIGSNPISIESSIYFLDKTNKLVIFN